MARGLESDSVSDSSVRSGSIRSSVCGLLTGEKDASMLCAACLVVPVFGLGARFRRPAPGGSSYAKRRMLVQSQGACYIALAVRVA